MTTSLRDAQSREEQQFQKRDWVEQLTGSTTQHGKNPMPKIFFSSSIHAGSNGTFKDHKEGNLGIRHWDK
ncbi:MAG: hypothetical protein ACI86H_002715 [bacterium]|jgi:hypothetical protein